MIDNLYYHYCGFESFQGIVSSKTFWLSSAWHMNDTTEIVWTLDEIWPLVRKRLLETSCTHNNVISYADNAYDIIKLAGTHYYFMCFTSLKDSLSQWTRYANDGTGVCLGVNLDKICKMGVAHTIPVPDLALGYFPVIYEKKVQEELLYQALLTLSKQKESRELLQIYVQALFQNVMPILKNPGFKEEQEVRLTYTAYISVDKKGSIGHTFYPIQGGPFKVSEIKTREKQLDGQTVVTSYVELDLFLCNGQGCIESVKIGPKCKKTVDEIYNILTKQGFTIEKSMITHSEIPYR